MRKYIFILFNTLAIRISRRCFITCAILFYATNIYAGDIPNEHVEKPSFNKLDTDFGHFSTLFYKTLLSANHYKSITNINILQQRANSLYDEGRIADSVGLILRNLKTAKRNVNTKAIINIEKILLNSNEITSAQVLYKRINSESDPIVISNVLFSFAKYNFNRENWANVIQTINKIINYLPPHQYNHAMLIEGISFQHIKKHRKAISYYKNIPLSSPYYINARVNMAVANIRQDWWTDAQIIFTHLLQLPKALNNKELSDRLYTIMGYSFLQQEYFRNSRNAFRNVQLDGPYTNKALLGIALDSAYQKDFIGALNAARILKNKKSTQLEVEESHLLLPYFYEKLHQYSTASAGYTTAIKYYENRIAKFNKAKNISFSRFKKTLGYGDKKTLQLEDETVSLEKYLPTAYFTQLQLLKEYQPVVHTLNNRLLNHSFNQLMIRFAHIAYKVTQNDLNKQSRYITDYMNQCRYGLARMFDTGMNRTE